VINEALLSTGESCAGLAASALWTVTPCIGRRHVGHVGVQTSCEHVVVGAVLCVLYCVITVTTDWQNQPLSTVSCSVHAVYRHRL